MYKFFFKPVLDFLFAAIALILISPILIITAIALITNNNGSLFFLQNRPGKSNVIFRIVKFKTMNDKEDEFGNLLSDSERLTSLGKIIRKLSIDEIPQLLNVLKGDMSLIGPRPLLTEYLALYNETQKKRHNVKPGITGWAQINGRNTISWEKKFEYDVWYVENLSLILDIKIIFKTIIKVFRAKDINTENQATTLKFTGNE